MGHRVEVAARGKAGLAVLGASVLVLAMVGCDGSVKVEGPRWNIPTGPDTPVTPSGAGITETRPIQGVSGLSLTGVGLVRVVRGGAESLTITAPENIMPLLRTEVVGGQLILGWDGNVNYQGQVEDIYFEVAVRELNEVLLRGAGEIDASGVDTDLFTVDLSGVGDIRASGTADRQEIRVTGVGAYHAPDLSSRVAQVHITGSGQAQIRVSERIEGYVGFPCVLEYWGNPELAVSGNGTIRQLGFN